MSNDSTELSPSPGSRLRNYVTTPVYSADLAATRRIWSVPDVLATAGVFVFLTYLAVPDLLRVRRPDGRPSRSMLEGMQERAFLLRLIGLDQDPVWSGGIHNSRTRELAALLTRGHHNLEHMRQEFMDFISAIIALAPLRVYDHLPNEVSQGDRTGYWRYMSQAMSLFGTTLRTEAEESQWCAEFVNQHSRSSAEGQLLFRSLNERHPRYVRLALPTLFGASRPAVESFMSDADAA